MRSETYDIVSRNNGLPKPGADPAGVVHLVELHDDCQRIVLACRRNVDDHLPLNHRNCGPVDCPECIAAEVHRE